MFELLNWENSSLTQHDFKKNRDYRQISEAYFRLLYTSDAADDMQCVDLGGRRIIKKTLRM